MKKEKKLRILYFIQLPPPVHGVSVINNQVYSSRKINENYKKHLLEIKFSNSVDELRKLTFKKVFYFLSLNIKLIYALISINPDIVYFSLMPVGYGFYRDMVFVVIMKLFRKKIIYHLHNRGIAKKIERRFNRFLYTLAFNKTNIIHLSNRLVEEEFAALNLKNTKFHIVPNGVDINFPKVQKEKVKDQVRLLFISNLFVEKGLFDLLKVFENICYKYNNVYLSIVGASVGQVKKKLLQLIEDHALKDRVIYHGPLYNDAKLKVLLDSDIFIFPSYFSEECFPLVILEAMAAGLPVIATKVGVINEIIDDSTTGFLVTPKDNLLLADRLETLIEDKQLMLSMGNQGRLEYIEKYSFPVFEQNMNKTLKEIVKIFNG